MAGELSARIVTAPNRLVFAPSGVWGGLNGQGIVVAHFYTEGRDFPEVLKFSVKPDGGVAESPSPAKATFLREIHSTLMFDADMAEAVGNWLLEKAKMSRGAINEVTKERAKK